MNRNLFDWRQLEPFRSDAAAVFNAILPFWWLHLRVMFCDMVVVPVPPSHAHAPAHTHRSFKGLADPWFPLANHRVPRWRGWRPAEQLGVCLRSHFSNSSFVSWEPGWHGWCQVLPPHPPPPLALTPLFLSWQLLSFSSFSLPLLWFVVMKEAVAEA